MDEQIIDTCCLLNLYTTGIPESVLDHFGGVHVSEHVQSEALWIREFDKESPPQLIPKQIDLTHCINDGVISICRLESDQEFELFVQMAQELDDGEASVLAIAKSRSWIAATDDKKARRIAAEHEIKTITTSEMIHAWTTSQQMSNAEVGSLLLNIQQFGRFVPRRSDLRYEWWQEMLEAIQD